MEVGYIIEGIEETRLLRMLGICFLTGLDMTEEEERDMRKSHGNRVMDHSNRKFRVAMGEGKLFLLLPFLSLLSPQERGRVKLRFTG